MYFGTSGSDHVHKFEVTSLAHDNYGNSSAVCLVDNQPISYAEFTYLSSDGGCTCQSIGDSEFYSCEKLQLIHMPALAKVDCVYTGAFS